MTTNHPDDVKSAVRERYGAEARRVIELAAEGAAGDACCAPQDASDACCSPQEMNQALRIYDEAQLAALPAESIAASLGCGNPTALAGLQEGERVLDLGSGGGIDCFLAAGQVGAAGRVIGLDMTPSMLELARKNLATLGLANVEFVQGEMERMPLPDACVDVVISNCVVCLSPDKEAVFREAFRVLAPGGRMHLTDMMREPGGGPDASDLAAWAECSAGAEPQDAYLDRLARAGFVGVAFEEEPRYPSEDGVFSAKVVARKPS